MRAFGKIDIVVNNAAPRATAPSRTITDEVWREDLDQKLFARSGSRAWSGRR